MAALFGSDFAIFGVMVFIAVVLLFSSVIVPTVGTEAQATKRVRNRIDSVLDSIDPGTATILRDRYLGNLSPFERRLESVPGMKNLRLAVKQAGIDKPAYSFLIWGMILGIFGAILTYLLFQSVLFSLIAGAMSTFFPIGYVKYKRNQRLSKFEEQLPEALDLMSRALQAGHPFNETLKMVGEEMSDPIAIEFSTAFTDINYGLPVKTAFISMLQRVPSISLNTLVTAVLIQQESGGKIAEILAKIAAVIRSRFKLQRRVKTLSAEGRMTAWVLTLLPFFLAAVIAITTPTYLPMMTKDPLGLTIIGSAFLLVVIGNFWIRKIIRFKY